MSNQTNVESVESQKRGPCNSDEETQSKNVNTFSTHFHDKNKKQAAGWNGKHEKRGCRTPRKDQIQIQIKAALWIRRLTLAVKDMSAVSSREAHLTRRQ